MSRKLQKRIMTDDQIAVQEARIPGIASKAFSHAYRIALANGAALLVVRDGFLFEVTQETSVLLRSIGDYGKLKSGTRLYIKKTPQPVT